MFFLCTSKHQLRKISSIFHSSILHMQSYPIPTSILFLCFSIPTFHELSGGHDHEDARPIGAIVVVVVRLPFVATPPPPPPPPPAHHREAERGRSGALPLQAWPSRSHPPARARSSRSTESTPPVWRTCPASCSHPRSRANRTPRRPR